MLNNLKNWWAAIVAIIVIILDLGFDAVNTFLESLSVSPKLILVLKAVFGIYALVKLKLEPPTQNPEKLQKIVDKQVAKTDGDPIPGKGF